MRVNDREYKYTIVPRFGKLNAEIYQSYDDGTDIHLISKNFGSLFKGITRQDYIDAKHWAEQHLLSMFIANTDQL